MNILKIIMFLILYIIYVLKINYTTLYLKADSDRRVIMAFRKKAGWLISIPVLGILVLITCVNSLVGYVVWVDLLFTLIMMTIVDIKHHIIPNQLNFLLLSSMSIAGVIANINYELWYIVIFAIVLLILYLISRFTNEQIGMGDVKLVAIVTLIMGGAFTIYTMLFSMIIMVIYAIPMMIAKKLNLKSQLPFVPFYTVGVVIFYIFNLV